MAMTHGKANTLSPGSIKRMLTGASPKNPTYVLGSVVSDFNSQGPTELTVNKGEEIYILFEINDWAFVTLLKDSSRRGYIPVDYCDVIQDFFSFNPAVCTWQVEEFISRPSTPTGKHPKAQSPVARRSLFPNSDDASRAKLESVKNSQVLSTPEKYRTIPLARNAKQEPKPRSYGLQVQYSPVRTETSKQNGQALIAKYLDISPSGKSQYSSMPDIIVNCHKLGQQTSKAIQPRHALPKESNGQDTALEHDKPKNGVLKRIIKQANKSRAISNLASTTNAQARRSTNGNNQTVPRCFSTDFRQLSLETVQESAENDETISVSDLPSPMPVSAYPTNRYLNDRGSSDLHSVDTPAEHSKTALSSAEKEQSNQIDTDTKPGTITSQIFDDGENVESSDKISSDGDPVRDVSSPVQTAPSADSHGLQINSNEEGDKKSDNIAEKISISPIDTTNNTDCTDGEKTESKGMESASARLTTLAASLGAYVQTEMTWPTNHALYCCCNHHDQLPAATDMPHSHHHSDYLHMLQFMKRPLEDSLNSPGNDASESGLGDTESIQSAGELNKKTGNTESSVKSHRLSDSTTQTTGSLEDLSKQYKDSNESPSAEKDGPSDQEKTSRIADGDGRNTGSVSCKTAVQRSQVENQIKLDEKLEPQSSKLIRAEATDDKQPIGPEQHANRSSGRGCSSTDDSLVGLRTRLLKSASGRQPTKRRRHTAIAANQVEQARKLHESTKDSRMADKLALPTSRPYRNNLGMMNGARFSNPLTPWRQRQDGRDEEEIII